MNPFDVDPTRLADSLVALVIAFVLALPVAWHRERESRRLGLRTLPLVAVASCSYMLLGSSFAGGDPNALGRVLAGLMTGIGFVGGGAILKSDGAISGTSTAAAIWAMGGLGAAVAVGRIDLAIAITVVTFLTFLLLTPLGERLIGYHAGDERPTGTERRRRRGS